MAELDGTQALLSRLIRATSGVERTLARGGDEAEALRAALASTVRSDDTLDAVHRLEVYANAYFFRILDCLAEDFPSLARALGETAFHDLITAYLLDHPSDSPSIRHVGRHLPSFLERAARAAWARERFPWAADLARLEWAFLEAFDAADAPVATRADYAAVAPDAFAELRFALDPSVQHLALDPRALRVHRAIRADEDIDPGPASDGAEHILIWRRDERVTSRSLAPDEARALDALAAGASFGEICMNVARSLGDDAAPAAVAGWLAGWLDGGCLARPDGAASSDAEGSIE